MKKILISVLTLFTLVFASSCSKDNPTPKNSPTINCKTIGISTAQGNFTRGISFDVHVPNQVENLIVTFPTLAGHENIVNLALPPQDQEEFEAHDILLSGKVYLDVKGAKYVNVEVPMEYLNNLKPGGYQVILQVEDNQHAAAKHTVDLAISSNLN
ncbi:hypothetical protein [Flammeovirga agarivorans]|uniref:DUF4625 domain-containing protein n=1 Tax=Flammeovirga agarivorans TaxID=2726742 RepID=A0A7X8SJN9_9BACT|nr:hypothetical protein [Flammeovirga agarivorans]NLR91358.1 hypothetical protein [Flammeovirga agarivorans]